MNVYFCGMIGSGKTTIGRRLAARLRLPFRDLDEEMDRRLGYSFHRLVHERGWLAFRELEYEICKDFSALDHTIVCLGGGTVRYEWNLDVLKPTGPFILCEASVETLVARVRIADRPRVNEGLSLEEDIRRMWTEEGGKYRAAADLSYCTEAKSVDAEVEELAGLIAGDPRFASVISPLPVSEMSDTIKDKGE